jgi:ABC-2 type transport system ATP-binding protein
VATVNGPQRRSPHVISFQHVHKRYGTVAALDDLTVEVESGRITAFLGANGSGKTTSMRVLLGLSDPDSGTATVNGRRYRDMEFPMRTVGAVLDQGFHPNRSAFNTLRIAAMQAGAPAGNISELLAMVGLTGAARRRVGGFSLGMRQRLALAAALIGDPAVLVLDEPFNGLDPDGISIMRTFLRDYADAGGTVFLSSHLLAEVAQSADDAVIIDKGRLVKAGPVAELSRLLPSAVLVSTTDTALLSQSLVAAGLGVSHPGGDLIEVTGATAEDVGRVAASVGAVVTRMQSSGDDLETVFATLIHHQEGAP